MRPRHHTVIGHQDGVILVGEVGHQLAHVRRTGRAIGRDADGAKHFILRQHARRRRLSHHGERGCVRRMAVAGGDRLGLALHHLQVHQDFARALLRAAKLIALEIHEAHVRRLERAFAHERRRADGDVVAHADGHVAAVAVHVGAFPQAVAHRANLFLERVAVRGIEERVEVGLGRFGMERGGRGRRGRGQAVGCGRSRRAPAGVRAPGVGIIAQRVLRRWRENRILHGRVGVASLGDDGFDVFSGENVGHELNGL